MTDWNAAQYLKFKTQRTQPAIDLARRIDCDSPRKILDVGCGPGNSTEILARRFPEAAILGIDNAEDMIKTARETHPSLEFRRCDAGSELHSLDGPFDVVFSNACIQWIADHERLLADMLALLRPGGVLAIQIPMQYQEPIHRIISGMIRSDPWRSALGHLEIFHHLSSNGYVELLADIAADFDVWETTYYHILGSHEDILEWYRGTGLRPFLAALPEADRTEFTEAVFREVVRHYPPLRDGRILFRFPRFFATAKAGPTPGFRRKSNGK
jgi:trans-aconitate 2-methyltransferase